MSVIIWQIDIVTSVRIEVTLTLCKMMFKTIRFKFKSASQ